MRDLDSELTGLRDTLREAVHQPPTEEMIKRGRRRVRRQQAQVAAVITLIAAAGVWPFLNAAPQATGPAGSSGSHVLSQDYFDTRSGFALGAVCGAEQCDPWFMSTSDGETWVKRDVPPIEVTAVPQLDRVIALGASKVVIEDYRGNWADRYYSGNGGQTWSAVPVRPETTVQQIPPDAVLETKVMGPSLCRDGAVIAMLSDSGRSVKLANQPPIELTWCQPYPDLNGTRWVGGNDPRTRRPILASTQDHGLTWQVTPLPAFTPPSAIASFNPQVSVVSTHAASYATVINAGGGELVAIFSSTDRGVTWTQAWQASDGKQPTHMMSAPVAGTDGSIRISQYPRSAPSDVWVSTDGAKNFVKQANPQMGEVLLPVRAGYLSSSRDSLSTGRFSRSDDGMNWRPVHIPIPE